MDGEQRVIKIFPYSYSSLTSFETCPRKHHGEKLTKEFERPYVKAADDGDQWHKQAEQYALQGTPIPASNPYARRITRVIDEVKSSGGEFHAELELCVTKDLHPTGWWDATGYTRAKLDLVHIHEGEATSIDWKTGRADPFSTQLKHSALLLFCIYPELKVVHTRYEWLKPGYATKGKVYREFFDKDWANFEARVARYEKAHKNNDWPAKQSGLCKKYCGVTTCEHWRK